MCRCDTSKRFTVVEYIPCDARERKSKKKTTSTGGVTFERKNKISLQINYYSMSLFDMIMMSVSDVVSSPVIG